MRLQAAYYAIGLSKTLAIEFDNVIAEVEKNILDTNTSLDAIIVLVHSSSRVNICVLHVKPYETDNSYHSKIGTDMRFYT